MKIVNKIGKKTLAISTIAILALSFIGGAAVVNHLSNESIAEVNVSSPIELELREGDSWRPCASKSLDLGDITGGDTAFFRARATKLGQADTEIEATMRVEIFNPLGMEGFADEFKSIEIEIWENSYTPGSPLITVKWTPDDGWTGSSFIAGGANMGRVNYYTTYIELPIYIGSGIVRDYYDISAEFSNYAYGDYEISMQII